MSVDELSVEAPDTTKVSWPLRRDHRLGLSRVRRCVPLRQLLDPDPVLPSFRLAIGSCA